MIITTLAAGETKSVAHGLGKIPSRLRCIGWDGNTEIGLPSDTNRQPLVRIGNITANEIQLIADANFPGGQIKLEAF